MPETEGAPKTEKKPSQATAAQDHEIDKDAEDTKEGYGWGV